LRYEDETQRIELEETAEKEAEELRIRLRKLEEEAAERRRKR
jgi:hypothetical protein